jgi:GTPase
MDSLKSNKKTAERLTLLEASVRKGTTAVSYAVDELADLMGLKE